MNGPLCVHKTLVSRVYDELVTFVQLRHLRLNAKLHEKLVSDKVICCLVQSLVHNCTLAYPGVNEVKEGWSVLFYHDV